ncbi:protein EMBRYONIC FLOWER 1-like [Macadamia integrifolia]|uniref:protein EMBRYONIC FLOWER 1-like n=1 Tax=Macadamia integrifolia TaxID=60698 RepID=UPI001C52D988|nr:protein EMBRYONIC FLOWER 1-like [Macadamia integrifolia]XP_042476857.1 protein EMBRYONIC FLOWER 1-like [Macadamia integrifolia]XP_042476858.1 protein EMBRYONIC FLOWER 1-like [Macadamia integrifolia]XP_042476859.1 protein EMBRYONIC FLOWER 1-like [Macadamia integrifolia]
MDESVVGDGNHTTIDLTPVVKSCIPLIESQPSELDSADKKHETDRCGHFSIRGYVAEVRRKDRKICWPFLTVDNSNKLEEQTLPPLHVPEFRWWCCQNCLRKIEAKESPIETGVLTNCSNLACRTKTTTSPGVPFTLSCGDAQKLHSGFQQSSEVNIVDGRKFSSDVSLHAGNAEHWPALFGNRKEKGAEVEHTVAKDSHRLTDGIPEDNLNLAICKPTCSPNIEDTGLEGVNFMKGGILSTNFQICKKGCDLSSNETAIASLSNSSEKRVLGVASLKSKGYELVNSTNEIFHKESATVKSKGDELVNSSTEIFHREKPEFSRTNLAKINGEHKDVVTSSVISEVDKEASNAVMCQTTNLHTMVSIDSSNESDEDLSGEHVQDQYHASEHGNSGDTSHGSKPRKLRLLTDIIRREGLVASDNLHDTERDATTGCMKTVGAQSKATMDAPSGMAVDPVTNNQMAFQGTDKKVMLGKKKKLMLPWDQDEGTAKMGRQSGATENIKIRMEDSQIKNTDNLIANGKLAGDASLLIGLLPGSKSFLGKHRNGKKLILGKEEKDISQVEDSLSSLLPRYEVISKEVEVRKDAKIKCMGSEHVSVKPLQDGVAGKDFNSGAQSCVAAEQKGQNLVLEKKKSKVPQVEAEKSPVIPWQEGIPHKDLIIKRCLDRKRKIATGAQSVVAAKQKGQNIVLDKKKSKVPQVEAEKSSVMPWEEGMQHRDLIMKRHLDKKHKIAPSNGLKSARGPCTGRGIHRGLKHHMQTHRKGTLNKKRKHLPQVECRVTVPGENGTSFIFQPKDSFNACNYENATNVAEPSKLSIEQCDQVADKISEQAASDDIPMEIVELMARNQYERRLDYAKDATENRYSLSETTEKVTDSGLMDSTEALRLLRENSNLQKSQSSKAKDGMFSGPSEGLTKQKSDACPSSFDGKYNSMNFSTSRLEQAQASSGLKAFSEHQGKLPSQVQFPVIGSRRSYGTENCTWDGDMVGQRCFNTSAQSSGAYHTSQVILPQSSFMEAQPVWSSGPNRVPFESNSPQKLVTGVSNSNRLSQSPDPLPKGYVNWETNEGVHPDYLFACTDKGNVYYPKMRGPLDLYANETLSAMYLLKLMHAGVCSSSPLNMNDNPERFPKDPPFPHDQIISELTVAEASVSKSDRELVNIPSCDFHGKLHHLGKPHERFPPVSIAKPVDSSAPKDVIIQRTTGFTGGFLTKTMPRSLKHQAREGKKRSYSPVQTRGPKLHMSASIDNPTSENHKYVIHDLKKGFLCLQASDFTKFPEQSQTEEGSSKHVQLKISRIDETISPVERISRIESCTVNRNPADFTVPEAGNIYMIGPADLKYKKKRQSRESGGLINRDGNRRQKKMKLTTIKEQNCIYLAHSG